MVTSLKTTSTFTQQLGLSSDMSNRLLTNQMKSIFVVSQRVGFEYVSLIVVALDWVVRWDAQARAGCFARRFGRL